MNIIPKKNTKRTAIVEEGKKERKKTCTKKNRFFFVDLSPSKNYYYSYFVFVFKNGQFTFNKKCRGQRGILGNVQK